MVQVQFSEDRRPNSSRGIMHVPAVCATCTGRCCTHEVASSAELGEPKPVYFSGCQCIYLCIGSNPCFCPSILYQMARVKAFIKSLIDKEARLSFSCFCYTKNDIEKLILMLHINF